MDVLNNTAIISFLVVFLWVNTSVDASTYTDAANLFKELTANYTKELRPVTNQSHVVNVQVLPFLRSINSYDEVTGALSLILVLTMQWVDERLQWDPTQFGSVSSLVIPQKNIWKPELFLVNPASKITPIGNDAFKIRVEYDGATTWFTGGDIVASCSPDMTYFPFDIQTCNLIFASWGYMSSEVIMNASSFVDLSNLTANGAWTLKESTYKVYDIMMMSMVEVIIVIERKSLYYIMTLIFPILSLCFLNPMVFTLPYESGERVSFCITILLSFAIFMTMTGEVIPKVSEPMPLLAIYLFIVQTFSGIITTINGLIFRAYDHNDDDPVPPFLWKIVLVSSKIFGCACCKKSSVHPKKGSNEDNVQLEDYQASDNNTENKDSKPNHQQPSWLTVAKTMDRVSFFLSYFSFISLSSIFLVHSRMRGGM